MTWVCAADVRCNRLRAEFGLLRLLTLGRQFVGHDIVPEEVWFDYPAPEYREAYTRAFRGRERFDQPNAGFVFATELLDVRQPHADPECFALLRAEADALLEQLRAGERFRDRVLACIQREFRSERPTMRGVARVLGVSERTLRRRLEREGASFQRVADGALATRARELLSDPERTVQQAADEMGFSDTSAFHRAFRRWTGMAPSAYRAAQLAAGGEG